VAWAGPGQDDPTGGIFARRFDSLGNALDPNDFQVNTYTTNYQYRASVGVAPSGDFVVVWTSGGQYGSGGRIHARRYDSAGNPLDPTDFQVNTFTTSTQDWPSVGVGPKGEFVVAWESNGQDGSDSGIFARRFDSAGNPLDPTDFQVNTFTTSRQHRPSVGVAPSGDFVVAWTSYGQDGSGDGIFAQRFSCDTDGDGLCDAEDILLTFPLDGGTLDCRTPGQLATRPLITWSSGHFDRFRVLISWNPSFPKKQRITSGDKLMGKTQWRPSRKKWRRACNKAHPDLYVRVFGVDRNVGKKNPWRKTRSNLVTTDLLR
jgi:hypothetical protein